MNLNAARPAVTWPALDRNGPKPDVELVIPEPGHVAGAIVRIEHPDGHRTAGIALCDDGDWTLYRQPLPAEPPSPAFVAQMAAARRWLKEGP